MNLIDVVKDVIAAAPHTDAAPTASYYIERSSIVQLDELQDFQGKTFESINPKCKSFVLPKSRTYRADAWAQGGALLTARLDQSGDIIGSMIGILVQSRDHYAKILNMQLLAGRDCWFDKSTLYMSSGLVGKKYNHYGVIERLLMEARQIGAERRIDSVCFLVTANNLPMIRAALRTGFYVIGYAYNADIKCNVYLFEYERSGMFNLDTAEQFIQLPQQDASMLEIENLLDNDHVITGINISARQMVGQKQKATKAKLQSVGTAA